MTRLSVNINKVATLRNSRGGNLPNLIQVAKDCEAFGAEGITVHPRPDERHIRYSDVPLLKNIVTTEYNIEGYPNRPFLDLVLANRPDQCTLVPDGPGVLTSDQGWDTIGQAAFLKEVVAELQAANIRVSLFVDAEERFIEGAKDVGAERIEFYTGHYAKQFLNDPEKAVAPHARCGALANQIGLGINAGHDLNLENLSYYRKNVPELLEVSIGHALISDALYFGLQNVIQMYLRQLK
ncbi:pyridoxine 5'-phosphate synthase [Lewinella cohaerens]|uniref:pyridoxine 5'-phosphate synthase n=1 Tax=Lewinella cohaerens TaxID=70995 RepID=UPI00035C5C14|nr:pyridoxine 5'-phosphate synthase [Lewinella cohaerens]